MTRCYVILRDTLGDGLDTFDSINLEVIEEKDLDEFVQGAIDQILEEEGAETVKEYYQNQPSFNHVNISSEIVVLECSETVKNLPVDEYVKQMCKKYDESVKEKESEEYKEYLRLKEKFEGDG